MMSDISNLNTSRDCMDCENANVRPTILTNSCGNVSTSQQSFVCQVGSVRRGQVLSRSIRIRQRRSKESIEVRSKRLRADAQISFFCFQK